MMDWKTLVRLSDEELAHVDVAQVNLACTAGLPDADQVNVTVCLQQLDAWAEYVGRYTQAALPEFHAHPEEYDSSEPYFRALCLITGLQRDCGVRYNPAKIPEDVPLDTADTFVHGAILGEGGTCSSLPVVYVAVGRRLGYPLKLVSARGKTMSHLFVRWEDESKRFNIDASGIGLSTPDDDYYRSGIYEHNPQAEKHGGILRSQRPREELAGFLRSRGYCWLDHHNYRQAADSFAWALAVAPGNSMGYNNLVKVCNEWGDRLRAREPQGFPEMVFRWPTVRRFPDSFPLDFERDILTLETWENVLNEPELDQRWWEPMRRGLSTSTIPCSVRAELTATTCELSIKFRRGEFRYQGAEIHV